MKKTNAKILLAAVFAARGTSFIFSKALMDTISPMNVLGVRFTLAFLILAVIFIKKLIKCTGKELLGGALLGALYTGNMVLEMYGLRLIDSGVSALIENMAILLVPVYAAIVTRRPPEKKIILCAVLAVIGVGFLSLTQLGMGGGSLGLFLTICATIAYTSCIIVTAKVAHFGDPVTIGVVQMGTMGGLSLIIALIQGNFVLPSGTKEWSMILILVLLCSCFGFTFQPLGQKYVSEETAAVFTVINPLTAGIMSIVIAKESLSVFKITGFILILISLVICNLGNAKDNHSLKEA